MESREVMEILIDLEISCYNHMRGINTAKEGFVEYDNYKNRREALSQAIELIKENEDLKSMWKTLNKVGKENIGIILLKQKTKIASLEQVLQRVDDVEGIKVILWKSFGDVYDDASYTHTAQALHSWLKGEK